MPQSAGSTALVVIEEAPRRGFRFPWGFRLWPGSKIGLVAVAGLCVSCYTASIQTEALHLDLLRFEQEMMRAKRVEQRAVRAEERAVRAEERAERAEKASGSGGGWFGCGKK